MQVPSFKHRGVQNRSLRSFTKGTARKGWVSRERVGPDEIYECTRKGYFIPAVFLLQCCSEEIPDRGGIPGRSVPSSRIVTSLYCSAHTLLAENSSERRVLLNVAIKIRDMHATVSRVFLRRALQYAHIGFIAPPNSPTYYLLSFGA